MAYPQKRSQAYRKLAEELHKLQAENELLAKALAYFSAHRKGCAFLIDNGPAAALPCNCGYHDAIRACARARSPLSWDGGPRIAWAPLGEPGPEHGVSNWRI